MRYSEGLTYEPQPDGSVKFKSLWRRPSFHHVDMRRLSLGPIREMTNAAGVVTATVEEVTSPIERANGQRTWVIITVTNLP